MELVNPPKDPTELSGLRLVPDQKLELPAIQKQFVNFMFFRVSPEWRKLSPDVKESFKDEFEAVYNGFADHFLLFSYSLVGFDSKADIMLWRIGTALDPIQDMTSKLYRTEAGSFLETTANYLSATKKMMFVQDSSEDRQHVCAGTKKYHFLFPCLQQSAWYEKSDEERDALIEESFMIGRKFSNIRIHLTHAFGFSETEYIVSFETDEPKDFLALVEELRQTTASKFTRRGMPVYTCRQRPLRECLDALG